MATEPVQAPPVTTKQDKAKSRKKIFLFIAVIVLIIASAAFAALLVLKSHNKKTSSAATTNSTQDSYDSQKAALVSKLNASKDDKTKAATTEALAQLANDNGDRKTALNYAKQAAALNPNANTYAVLAITAELSGDKTLAASSYAKAAEMSQASMHDEYGDYAFYKGKQLELEAAQ